MPVNPKNIQIKDYTYELPADRIAQFPLKNRDESKLLIYDKGSISGDVFRNISRHIPEGSMLIFNDTKVVNARLIFHTLKGKAIEIFCLEPENSQSSYSRSSHVIWKCMVGNLKAWKWKDEVLQSVFSAGSSEIFLKAELIEQVTDSFIINFSWSPPHLSFAEVLESAGLTPLPPYMKREPVEEDKITYQTIYASCEGSVAAPTAGLHFTNEVITSLKEKNIVMHNLTLHVGAGTFKPVKSEKIIDHEMHSERFFLNKKVIEEILSKRNDCIISAGTTTLRTIESIYWYGVQLIQGRNSTGGEVYISQWEPYEHPSDITMKDSLTAVIDEHNKTGENLITGRTSIMIVPGYEFKIFSGLITNFHQPRSTLLLLIAAFIGGDWKSVYEYALNYDFRFLSYGDSSILF